MANLTLLAEDLVSLSAEEIERLNALLEGKNVTVNSGDPTQPPVGPGNPPKP